MVTFSHFYYIKSQKSAIFWGMRLQFEGAYYSRAPSIIIFQLWCFKMVNFSLFLLCKMRKSSIFWEMRPLFEGAYYTFLFQLGAPTI